MTGGKDPNWGLHGFGLHVSSILSVSLGAPINYQTNMNSINTNNIPLEPARAGAQDGSQSDPPVTTASQRNTRLINETNVEKRNRACTCGWEKVTTLRGLKIHQGKKGCLNESIRENRIDGYFLRSHSNKSSENQRPESHHSSQDLYSPENQALDTPSNNNVPPLPKQPARCVSVSTPVVKWPRASEIKEWRSIDDDLVAILGGLRGSVERKLDQMGGLIYDYGADRFGMREINRKAKPENISRRQREIKDLVRKRRQLKKQWKKATDYEKEGINTLQNDLKMRLTSLRRAENHRKKRKSRERTRMRFFKDPFKFVKSLFIMEKGGTLNTSKQVLDEYIKGLYTDVDKDEIPSIPSDIPPIGEQEYPMDIDPPRLKEIEQVVRKARSSSAPGPNGIPYRFYKNTPGVLRFLWKLMKVAWQKGIIPVNWRRATGVLIPKDKNSTEISQFRPISLLNVEGKIFFSVLAQRMSRYLLSNGLIDTGTQKAGISGFAGCLEHTSMIWHQIQSAKSEKRDLHVVFLDLANAFSSVPHNFIWAAFDFFRVPGAITRLVKAYFSDLQLSFATPSFRTDWHSLEIGIMAGCTISPLAFTMAMEVIIRASKWVVKGERLKSGERLTPIRAYMDDTTTLTTSIPCTKRLLNKLQENIANARMKIKPSKSRSISIIKGKLKEIRFFIDKEPIPTISEKSVKSLGRLYDAKLKDTCMAAELRKTVIEGLASINKTSLPGKLKIWCLQYGLMPRLCWPLTIYDIPLSNVERMERAISAQIRKWLGLPPSLTNVALYGRGLFELPLSSLTEEFKCSKVRRQMILLDSKDEMIQTVAPSQKTGKKWHSKTATEQAIAAAKHKDIVGYVQCGKSGLGMGEKRERWSKASTVERRKMVINEVHHQEEQMRCARAVSQAKQGQWMKWEGLEKRKLSWKDLWDMEAGRITFLVRSIYDVLPTPTNLHQWLGKDPACPLCSTPATLRHILTACKVSLAQHRYTWRHNKVLRSLAAIIDIKRNTQNAQPHNQRGTKPMISFVREGQKPPNRPTNVRAGILQAANDWVLRVDLDNMLKIPAEIVVSTLRPDMLLYSVSIRKVLLIELTVPWEDAISEAYERKKCKYMELAAEMRINGWDADVYPVEISCRGFIAGSTITLLRRLGLSGKALRNATKNLSSVAEYSSRWLWLMRGEKKWEQKGSG